MTVGDPKRAAVLAVIAVGIVTIAVFRAIPSKENTPAQALTPLATVPEPEKQTAAAAPEVPSVDAFSHPNLAAKPDAAQAKQSKPDPRKPTSVAAERSGSGNRPWELDRGQTTITGSIPDIGGPEKNTGGSQQENRGEGFIKLRLDAVVRGATSVALISVAQGEAQAVAEGAPVNGHIMIVKILEDRVVIRVSGKIRAVRVGQEVDL